MTTIIRYKLTLKNKSSSLYEKLNRNSIIAEKAQAAPKNKVEHQWQEQKEELKPISTKEAEPAWPIKSEFVRWEQSIYSLSISLKYIV